MARKQQRTHTPRALPVIAAERLDVGEVEVLEMPERRAKEKT